MAMDSLQAQPTLPTPDQLRRRALFREWIEDIRHLLPDRSSESKMPETPVQIVDLEPQSNKREAQ